MDVRVAVKKWIEGDFEKIEGETKEAISFSIFLLISKSEMERKTTLKKVTTLYKIKNFIITIFIYSLYVAFIFFVSIPRLACR